ncbi:MAG: hypothetical protein WBB01_05290 [Phormidesmis sp.]
MSEKLNRLQRLGIMMLGAYVISGCSSPTSSNLMASDASTQESVVQVADEGTEVGSSTVAFEVCADVADWQRPSDAEQSKQIDRDARYDEALSDDPLKTASNQFWHHQVISFTTYGLSARMEPVNLSGLWTVADDLWDCYEGETTIAINQGDRAETWLLNHRVRELVWQGDRYVMTVEPTATGMQAILFDRVDELATLPLEVVTISGEAVAVMSGDWQ